MVRMQVTRALLRQLQQPPLREATSAGLSTTLRRNALRLQHHQQQVRRVQTTATDAAKTSATSTGATPATPAENAYKPGFFSRNPGITLGAIVLGITLYVVRGSKNKKNFDAVQTPIADEAVISPYEAWELRSSNDITCVLCLTGLCSV